MPYGKTCSKNIEKVRLREKKRVYGPEQQQITSIDLEPYPEDKKNGGYDRVNLSDIE